MIQWMGMGYGWFDEFKKTSQKIQTAVMFPVSVALIVSKCAWTSSRQFYALRRGKSSLQWELSSCRNSHQRFSQGHQVFGTITLETGGELPSTHTWKMKGTCFWKVDVSSWEGVAWFKCNNFDFFLFSHVCLWMRVSTFSSLLTS